MSDHEYILTIHYTSRFFTDSTVLWKRDSQGAHKQVLYGNLRMETMIAAHNDIGHRGYFATHAILAEQLSPAPRTELPIMFHGLG
jgi:hypothetical protein